MRQNRRNDDNGLPFIWLATANLMLCIAFLLFFVMCVTNYAQAEDTPPNIQPYKIPRFNGREGDFKYIPPVKIPKAVDADAVFRMIVNCFPERHKWGGVEIKAVGGIHIAQVVAPCSRSIFIPNGVGL